VLRVKEGSIEGVLGSISERAHALWEVRALDPRQIFFRKWSFLWKFLLPCAALRSLPHKADASCFFCQNQ